MFACMMCCVHPCLCILWAHTFTFIGAYAFVRATHAHACSVHPRAFIHISYAHIRTYLWIRVDICNHSPTHNSYVLMCAFIHMHTNVHVCIRTYTQVYVHELLSASELQGDAPARFLNKCHVLSGSRDTCAQEVGALLGVLHPPVVGGGGSSVGKPLAAISTFTQNITKQLKSEHANRADLYKQPLALWHLDTTRLSRYVCVCVYGYMYLCLCLTMCMCMCVCICVYLCVCIYVCALYAFMDTCMCRRA